MRLKTKTITCSPVIGVFIQAWQIALSNEDKNVLLYKQSDRFKTL